MNRRKRALFGCALVASVALGVATVGSAMPASAYTTSSLGMFLDFSNLSSVAPGTVIADLSNSGRDATVRGDLSFDVPTNSLQFPGGANGTAYLELAGPFSDFSNGFSFEFAGEFGVNRQRWARIFDFGIPGGANDDFLLGQYETSNELGLYLYQNGVDAGSCRTDTGGTALGPVDTPTFAHFIVTVGGGLCHMYKDGVELPTVTISTGGTTAPAANGSPYQLPLIANRTANYIARSNWGEDYDFAGALRFVRMYDVALTPDQVLENFTNPTTPVEVELPNTGVDTKVSGTLATGAALLALTGVALVVIRRRRNA